MAQDKKPSPEMDMTLPGLAGMMTALNPVASKAYADLMAESTQFMTDRVNSTIALQQEMMACRSPAELMELQSAYMQETLQECTAEMTRYATLMATSFGAITEDAKTGHKRSYDDVPV